MKLRRHFSLKGRIGIAAYWQTIAVAAMIITLYFILRYLIGLPRDASSASLTEILLSVLCLAVAIAGVWLYIAATVKRLHDTGRQATYLLWLNALCLGALILLFICGWSEGQHRANKYGEPSK